MMPPIDAGLALDLDGRTVSCCSNDSEDRVLLASTGFSDGKHYWEWIVEYFDGRGQPAFGIALGQVNRESMLGKFLF